MYFGRMAWCNFIVFWGAKMGFFRYGPVRNWVQSIETRFAGACKKTSWFSFEILNYENFSFVTRVYFVLFFGKNDISFEKAILTLQFELLNKIKIQSHFLLLFLLFRRAFFCITEIRWNYFKLRDWISLFIVLLTRTKFNLIYYCL